MVRTVQTLIYMPPSADVLHGCVFPGVQPAPGGPPERWRDALAYSGGADALSIEYVLAGNGLMLGKRERRIPFLTQF